jgi:hypothetical protein
MAKNPLELEGKVKSRRIKRKETSPWAESGTTQARETRRDEREILKVLIQSPATKYVASGVATAFLAYVAKKLSPHYPEISDFIQENLDMLQGRMEQYQTAFHQNEPQKH